MAYEPTVWKANDVITSAKLNKLEQGVAGGGLVKIGVTASTNEMEVTVYTLQKTAQEILDYIDAGCVPYMDESGAVRMIALLTSAEVGVGEIYFAFGNNYGFTCTNLSDYPTSGSDSK